MYPASEGDALALTWGEDSQLFHALVDLGRTDDYRAIRPTLKEIGHIELFTISHIDADHISGAVLLVKELNAPFEPADVWFNSWHHLRNAATRRTNGFELETLSARQGEKLSAGILKFNWPWNRAFGPNGIVSVDTPRAQSQIKLAGDLEITLLSPGDKELAALEPVWIKELARANLRPQDPDEAPEESPEELEVLSSLNVEALAEKPFLEDQAEPNGSSIAFLAQYGERRVLLGADAYPGVLERRLRQLGYSETNRLKLDLFKLCHHGSKANTSPSLLKIVDCVNFAISTDGSKYNHPDRETIARILRSDPHRHKTVYFNTNQEHAAVWNRDDLKDKYNFSCVMPPENQPGLAIDI
jgi:beta-lactamase superfamily II metal-dependent hydrolase